MRIFGKTMFRLDLFIFVAFVEVPNSPFLPTSALLYPNLCSSSETMDLEPMFYIPNGKSGNTILSATNMLEIPRRYSLNLKDGVVNWVRLDAF